MKRDSNKTTHHARQRYRSLGTKVGGDQLYDLRTDPDELHRLANKPMQGDRIARMKARIAAHLQAVSDAP